MEMNALTKVLESFFNAGESRAPVVLHAAETAPKFSGRVAALASISSCISDAFIVEQIARVLHDEAGSPVLLLELETGAGPAALSDWSRVRAGLNGEFGFADQVMTVKADLQTLSLRVTPDPAETGEVRTLLTHCRHHFQYVLLRIGADVPPGPWMEFLNHSDLAFVLFTPAASDLYALHLLLRESRTLATNHRACLKPVLCLSADERVENFDGLVREIGGPVHGFVRESLGSDQNFRADVRRLAREIGRRRVGLALSSGAARGLAHIGVIQVLEENGIEVDIVAGCSMGAYVGAVWASGRDGAEMERLAREVEGRWKWWKLIDPFLLPRRGFMRGERVKQRLEKTIGRVQFSDLVRPLRIVVTHLHTLERVIFAGGEVAAAVHASSAIPGLCAPVRIGGETYIDGGVAEPLPVEVLREMGIERIIAVNTIPTPAYLRCRWERDRELAAASTRTFNPLRVLLNSLNFFAPGNIFSNVLRSVDGAQMRVAEQACRDADVVLRPLCFDSRWHDFQHPGKYIALGREAALQHLDEIKTLVQRKDTAHEHATAHHALANAA